MTIDTRFDMGESVWIIQQGKAVQRTICGIYYEHAGGYPPRLFYGVTNSGKLFENAIFKTKGELIASL